MADDERAPPGGDGGDDEGGAFFDSLTPDAQIAVCDLIEDIGGEAEWLKLPAATRSTKLARAIARAERRASPLAKAPAPAPAPAAPSDPAPRADDPRVMEMQAELNAKAWAKEQRRLEAEKRFDPSIDLEPAQLEALEETDLRAYARLRPQLFGQVRERGGKYDPWAGGSTAPGARHQALNPDLSMKISGAPQSVPVDETGFDPSREYSPEEIAGMTNEQLIAHNRARPDRFGGHTIKVSTKYDPWAPKKGR